MSDSSSRKQRFYFAHPLLRARDWQDRPELVRLADWWSEIGKGVCALVGIGGAGKTATVERFLRVLPGVLPLELGVGKQSSLPQPRRLFVFSFYDAPTPDGFFNRLAAWLTDGVNRVELAQPSYEQVVRLLEYAGPCLLVLDGLEKVQEDGQRGAPFGLISDGRLRNFILRAAEGHLGEAAVLLTTRFALDDLRDRPALNYCEILVEQINEAACIALLRQRGVHGSDPDLVRLARACGCHALTVDLAGGYLANFAAGDPSAAGDWAAPAVREEGQPAASDRLRAVAEQTARFDRVARRYREALARTDRAALALLERVCLFRLGVDAELLTLVFTGPGKEEVSGPELAALSPVEVRARMEKLVAMRLLEATALGPRARQRQQTTTTAQPTVFSGVDAVTYTVHPAVRDGFLKGLDDDAARLGHDAACEGLVASLGGLPGRGAHPADAHTLDMLEEIVYHTLAADRARTAWEMYDFLIGGYENLGRRLGAYERGERICRAFVEGDYAGVTPLARQLGPRDQSVFLNDYALYLSEVGGLETAVHCFEHNIALRLAEGSWKNASICHQNLADLLLAAGCLAKGLASAEEAIRMAERASYAFERKDSYAYRGYALALRGETPAALEDFAASLNWQRRDEQLERPLFRMRGIQYAWLLARLGRNEEATRVTEANKALLRETLGEQHHYLPRCNLLLAGLARARGELSAARELQHEAQEWAVTRDAREPLCWAALEGGHIALADARRKADGPHGPETVRCLREARRAADEGLRIARECGFGIFHIDLLLLRAAVALEEGDAAAAGDDARTALETGHVGQPQLLPAADPACGYAWGIGLAHFLLAETCCLRAAQRFGQAKFNPDRPPFEARELFATAADHLQASQAIRRRIQDPTLVETERRMQDLASGVLTLPEYNPLRTRKESVARENSA